MTISNALQLLVVIVFGLVPLSCAPQTTVERAVNDAWPRFGAMDEPSGPTILIGALDDTSETVLVEGTVVEVCQTKGCWMKLDDAAGAEILVRFRDYAFFVPRNATGRHAIVSGRAERQTLSVEALRHLAQDAGKSDAEIAAITVPKDSMTFIADSVRIQGPGLADPYRSVGVESCPPLDTAKK